MSGMTVAQLREALDQYVAAGGDVSLAVQVEGCDCEGDAIGVQVIGKEFWNRVPADVLMVRRDQGHYQYDHITTPLLSGAFRMPPEAPVVEPPGTFSVEITE